MEEKIKAIYAAKNDIALEKYNLEAISKFIEDKFTNLNKTFATSDLERKRALMCWIFLKGLMWSYPGYSNTLIGPFYKCYLDLQGKQVRSGAAEASLLEPFKSISDWLLSSPDIDWALRLREASRTKFVQQYQL